MALAVVELVTLVRIKDDHSIDPLCSVYLQEYDTRFQ